jgi:hypothetical protein
MKKIISLFQRNYDGDRLVRDEVVSGAEWVAAGEGVATRKFDGTSCMVKDGVLYKRYDCKSIQIPPQGWIAAQEPDPVTGHHPGWLPVSELNPSDKWHRESVRNAFRSTGLRDGTYELVGPKIQGNPEKFEDHRLIPHGSHPLRDVPRTFEALKEWFKTQDIEGIVWHHLDGRMVKIKKKDFGLKR